VTAPAGAVVGIYVDLVERVGSGDVIETQSGRRYRVLVVREQTRGRHVGRQHLRCLVDPEATPDDLVYAGRDGDTRPGVVHTIRWYARGRS
jgi:hypothetical protein